MIFSVTAGKFQQYDHGKALNIIYYGTPEPSQYNLSAVTAPVSLYNGKNDWLSSIKVRTHMITS
jgi:hypothetical protein